MTKRQMLGRRYADNSSPDSVATRLRRRRFGILLEMLDDFEDPIQILDVGGRPQYWDSMLADLEISRTIHVTLLNLQLYPTSRPGMTSIVGDARAMPQFTDRQFDIVFSNSTIEHVGTRTEQRQMASEIRRVGKAYCVQTPNLYFPIEPHFLFPLFQFMPLRVRAWLLSHFSLGWYERTGDYGKAFEEVSSIVLLRRADVESMFPDASIFEERYAGLVKSFVAFRRASI